MKIKKTVVIYLDFRNGTSDIYAQRYSGDGIAIGFNFRVTNTSKNYQSAPVVKLMNNKIYATWTDYRLNDSKADIWANVLFWDNSIGISDGSQEPLSISLSQNYPNPFNASTNISYSIPTSGFVNLKVYDILGREIKNLAQFYHAL